VTARRAGRTAGAAHGAARSTVGLRDVARAAGVSTATVSRAINNPDVVSAEIRQRVVAVIQTLGWVPDGAARALSTRRSGAIGAIFPTMTHGDFARATAAIQAELQGHGQTLLLACSNYDLDQEYQQARQLIERGVDGLILVGENHHSLLLELLQRRRIPFVNTFVYSPASHGTCIGPDNRKALFELASYLAGLGHRVFGVLAQSTHNNDRAVARLAGIRAALAERGLAVRPQHFAMGEWTIAEGKAMFRRIMAAAPRPTAVICGNAYLAVGAVLESMAMGLSVPDELSIVGYDDIELMNELPVRVTTVKVNGEDIGRHAARFLLGAIEGKPADVAFEWGAEIIVRDSSGPAPKAKAGRSDRT
jgi:LacI family transcriptional regulator